MFCESKHFNDIKKATRNRTILEIKNKEFQESQPNSARHRAVAREMSPFGPWVL